MTTPKQLTDAELRAKALARWEGDGGALAPVPDHPSMDEATLRLLARLGAALLESWNDISSELHERIARRTRTLGMPGDHERARQLLDAFLKQYRNHY